VVLPTKEQYDANPENYKYRTPDDLADIAAKDAAKAAAAAAKEAAAKEAADKAAREAAAKEAEQQRRKKVSIGAVKKVQEAIQNLNKQDRPDEESYLENVLNYIMLNKYNQENYDWAVNAYASKFNVNVQDFIQKVEQYLKTTIFSSDFNLYFRFLYLYYKMKNNQAKLDELEKFYRGVRLRDGPLKSIVPFEELKLTGGNHETRRHRVRGMPKRAKTRRMY